MDVLTFLRTRCTFPSQTLLFLVIFLIALSNPLALDGKVLPLLGVYLLQGSFCYGILASCKKRSFLRGCFSGLFASVVFLQLAYGTFFSVSVLKSVFETSFVEATTFVIFNSGVFVVSCILWFGLWNCRGAESPKLPLTAFTTSLSIFLIASILTVTPRTPQAIFDDVASNLPGTSFFLASWKITKEVEQATNDPSWTAVQSPSDPSTLVVGFGESVMASRISLYDQSINVTPFLSSISDDLTVYKNAYAPGPLTWISMKHLLSLAEKNQPENSIITLAKEAGYKVFWFSSQPQAAVFEASTGMIAKNSDVAVFMGNGLDISKFRVYDEELLPSLENALQDPSPKKLIMLHFVGSHSPFTDRYPKTFQPENIPSTRDEEYDKSLRYFDYIQQRILQQVKKYDAKYAFVSDHGLIQGSPQYNYKHDLRPNMEIQSLHVPFFTFPKETLSFSDESLISLKYFECFFSEWSKITTPMLDAEYCTPFTGEHLEVYDSAQKLLKKKL